MLALEDYRLPNGLRVVLNEDHSAPLVALNLWYHVGSKNERPGRTGFAHLFEHMLFSGSEHIGNNEHFRYVQSVAGDAGLAAIERTVFDAHAQRPGDGLEIDVLRACHPEIAEQQLGGAGLHEFSS